MKRLFRPSLRKKLFFLAIVAYAFPVFVIISMFSDFITQQYDHQVLDKVELSLVETTELTSYYLASMTEYSRRISVEGDLERAYSRYEAGGAKNDLYTVAEASMQRAYRYNSLFHSASLYFAQEGLEGFVLVNDSSGQQKGTSRIYEEMYPRFLEISADIRTQICFYTENNRLYLLRNLVNTDFTTYGLLVLEVNTDRILGVFQGITGVCQVDIQFDEAQAVSMALQDLQEVAELVQLFHQQSTEGHSLGVTLWVDTDQGQEVLENLQNEITQILLLLLPAIGYMLFSFYRQVTRPIGRLMEAQIRVSQGELGHTVDSLPPSEELRAVTLGFNEMSRGMKAQFQQRYEEQLALQEARMKTLQSQINPHFLNNTLEIINWETRIAGAQNASAMIESLSVMLRATMDREGKGQIPFGQELTYVDAYLFIQSCRMGPRLSVERHILEESLPFFVPRLAFQPLVENACEHGIASQRQGKLVISTFLTRETLVLEVKNSGTMSKEREEEIGRLLAWDSKTQDYVNSAESLGIRNVNKRVKILYGEAFGIDLFNNNENMTVLRLALPRKEEP